MKIAFVTTQGLTGSTVIGRALPLGRELAKKHEVHVLVHRFSPPLEGGGGPAKREGVVVHSTGQDPFARTSSGKKRLKGIFLIIRLLDNALFTAFKLASLKPDIIIIEKSLPENVLATWLATLVTRPKKVILDVDDFELTANVTTSWLQRAAIHWAERAGAKLADQIVTVAPFLSDHFEQLTQGKKEITLIPTGIKVSVGDATGALRSPDGRSSDARRVGVQERQDPPVLIYAGSLTLTTGHRVDLLSNILALVKKQKLETVLHIYGDGDDVERLKAMFAEKNLSDVVTWHGRFTHETLYSTRLEVSEGILLDPIDGVVTNRSKSSFRVALAAVLGLPVISSNIGIRPYLIPNRLHQKFFAKPGDAQSYANKVLDLMSNPLSQDERETLKKHGAQFTWLQLAQKYEKIIES